MTASSGIFSLATPTIQAEAKLYPFSIT